MGDLEPRPGRPEPEPTDADRQRVVLALRDHVTEGRLTLDEFSDRCGEAWGSRTATDLAACLRDLPAVAAPVPEERRRKSVSTAVAIMGGHEQRSRWRAADEINAIAVMGGCELDFRQAEISGTEVVVNAFAIMGGVDIIVPEGIEVDLTGIAIMGGKENRVSAPARPGGPVIRVRAFVLMGGVTCKTRKPREQWLAERQAAREERRLARGSRASLPGPERAARALEAAHDAAETALDGAFPGRDRHRERPRDRGRQAGAGRVPRAPDGTVTIVFTDIAGSTAMTERLGDVAAREVLRTHDRIVRRAIADCDGFEVKTLFDGFMIAFASARKAVRCAAAVQQALADHNATHPAEPLRVRIGVHAGEAIQEDGDFTGRAVILASRIVERAEPGEILVSSLVKELTESSGEFVFDAGREVTLKGIARSEWVHGVVW